MTFVCYWNLLLEVIDLVIDYRSIVVAAVDMEYKRRSGGIGIAGTNESVSLT